jgi:hypothetical protein
VRALHRQLQLRPPRRRVHRVSFLASFIIGCSSPLRALVLGDGEWLSHTAPFDRDHRFSSPQT